MTLARCPLHWAHDLPNTELTERLAGAGLTPDAVATLVAERHTGAGERRIEAELGPLPELVESGLVPATTTDPSLCRCGMEADDPEPYEPYEPYDLLPARVRQLGATADLLPYDEVGWAQEVADAATAQAVADAAEIGW